MILGAEVTVAMMEEVKITPILKFTVPKTFMLEGMKGWLVSTMKRVVGGCWRRIVCVEWHLRAHYYIEFNMDNTVLYVKGLANAKDGTMRLVEFTRSREFNEVLRKHPVVVSRPATPPPVPINQEHSTIPTPFEHRCLRLPSTWSSAHGPTPFLVRQAYESQGSARSYDRHSRSPPHTYCHS
jgi:hypothetical protein